MGNQLLMIQKAFARCVFSLIRATEIGDETSDLLCGALGLTEQVSPSVNKYILEKEYFTTLSSLFGHCGWGKIR
jgi:hypothetical protein